MSDRQLLDNALAALAAIGRHKSKEGVEEWITLHSLQSFALEQCLELMQAMAKQGL